MIVYVVMFAVDQETQVPIAVYVSREVAEKHLKADEWIEKCTLYEEEE